jgi:hypothetical protein
VQRLARVHDGFALLVQVLQDGHAQLLRLQQRLLTLLDAVTRLLQLVVGAQQPVALRRARRSAARSVAW